MVPGVPGKNGLMVDAECGFLKILLAAWITDHRVVFCHLPCSGQTLSTIRCSPATGVFQNAS